MWRLVQAIVQVYTTVVFFLKLDQLSYGRYIHNTAKLKKKKTDKSGQLCLLLTVLFMFDCLFIYYYIFSTKESGGHS